MMADTDIQIAYEQGYHDGYQQALRELNDKKFEKVTRCKNCRFHCNEGERDSVPQWLPCAEIKTEDSWFCGWGEPKEGESE